MKDKLLKLTKNKYIYLLMFFLGVLFIHQFFEFSNDDITFFKKILDNYNLFEYLKERYNNWTSRILIESVLVNISRNIHLWRLCNSLVICLLIYTIEKLFVGKGTPKTICFTSLLFLLYPYYQMAEAGFAATTLNYLWPLTFLLFSFLPLRYIHDGKEIKKKFLPLYLLAFIYACNQEQAVCIAITVSIISLIYCIKNKKNITYPLLLLLISIFSIGFILLCPGNDIRTTIETTNCYPDYINANLLDKIYLGIVSTCSIIISNFLIIWLFSFVLLSIILSKKSKLYIKLLSWFQFIFITLISIYRVYIILNSNSILDAYTYGIFGYFTEVGNIFNFSLTNIITISLCLGMVLIYCILLNDLFKVKSLFIILMLLIGCGTRLLMGFSPTIFASGTRTMIFLYFSIISIILLLWTKYQNLFSKNKLKIFYLMIIIFVIVNYALTFVALPLIRNL